MGLEQNNEQHYREVVDKYINPVASVQMTTRDYVVRASADAESAAFTITLPPVAEAIGRFYTIIARTADATNTITIADKDDSELWGGDYILVANGNSVMFYSDGLRWWALFPGFGVLSVKTVLTSAQVKALAATPQVLVPALGATKLIEFLSATLFLDYGTNAFTEAADNFVIKYTDDSGVAVSDIIESTGFIDQTADMFTRGVPINDAIVVGTGCIGQQLVLDNNNAEIAGNAANDSTLTIWTLFRMIETG